MPSTTFSCLAFLALAATLASAAADGAPSAAASAAPATSAAPAPAPLYTKACSTANVSAVGMGRDARAPDEAVVGWGRGGVWRCVEKLG